MLFRRFCVLAVAGGIGVSVVPAAAQPSDTGAGCGPGGWGRQGEHWRLFDPTKLETLSGEVLSVQRARRVKGASEGVYLELKTEREQISVHLGPAWYLDNQDPPIRAKDRVEIVGSRVPFNGKPAIIASEIRRGDESLELRDAEGRPLWCGWRQRSSKGRRGL